MNQDKPEKKPISELIWDGFTAQEKDDMMEIQEGEHQMWRLGVRKSMLRRMKKEKEQRNPDVQRRKK